MLNLLYIFLTRLKGRMSLILLVVHNPRIESNTSNVIQLFQYPNIDKQPINKIVVYCTHENIITYTITAASPDWD